MSARDKHIGEQFLSRLFNLHELGGYLFLATLRDEEWSEFPIRNDSRRNDRIRKWRLEHETDGANLYFCPHLFHRPRRKFENAQLSRIAHCDIDAGDPEKFRPKPNIVIRTSPGRFQGYWLCRDLLSQDQVQAISHHLTYKYGGDRNGWSITKMLRFPGSVNFKPQYDRPRVKVVSENWKTLAKDTLLAGVGFAAIHVETEALSTSWLKRAIAKDARTLRRKHWQHIRNDKVRLLLGHQHVFLPDRSAQIYLITRTLINAGIPLRHVACMVFHSACFQSKHGKSLHALGAELSRIAAKLEAKS